VDTPRHLARSRFGRLAHPDAANGPAVRDRMCGAIRMLEHVRQQNPGRPREGFPTALVRSLARIRSRFEKLISGSKVKIGSDCQI